MKHLYHLRETSEQPTLRYLKTFMSTFMKLSWTLYSDFGKATIFSFHAAQKLKHKQNNNNNNKTTTKQKQKQKKKTGKKKQVLVKMEAIVKI